MLGAGLASVATDNADYHRRGARVASAQRCVGVLAGSSPHQGAVSTHFSLRYE